MEGAYLDKKTGTKLIPTLCPPSESVWTLHLDPQRAVAHTLAAMEPETDGTAAREELASVLERLFDLLQAPVARLTGDCSESPPQGNDQAAFLAPSLMEVYVPCSEEVKLD